MKEESPLLINNTEKRTKPLSKSFLLILSAFVLLLAASTATLGYLYYGSLHTIREDRPLKVKPGDALLLQSNFSQLAGYKLGLITNPTAVVDSVHIIDWLYFTPNNVNMTLTTLFGPEHGLRGSEPAGAAVNDSVDYRTGLPIYSLYPNPAPTPQQLQNVTALVFDIQDVGARFYTYISTLGWCMQAAANNSIPFFVLDRPNPIGNSISGWTMTASNESFVGQFPIPIQYGLTVGELAQMIKGENMFPFLENMTLNIIRMDGYSRDSIWSDTILPWISPSPNIIDLDTAFLYPGTCFFEAMNLATEGRGTLTPFKSIGAPWVNTTQLIAQLQSYNLPGVKFAPTQFVPVNITDMAVDPKFMGQMVYGTQITVTDRLTIKPVELGVYLMYTFYQQAPAAVKPDLIIQDYLVLLSGSEEFYNQLVAGTPPQTIISEWDASVQLFQQTRKPYLLYH